MALRFVKGKMRVESSRLKDALTVVRTDRERTVDRGLDGRFTAGNGAANGRAAKTLILASLGSGADADLVRQTTTMYRAILRTLPADGPSIRQLVASRCRHAVVAARLADEAARLGIASSHGLRLIEASRAHDQAAMRLAVVCWDLATREAAAQPSTGRDLAEIEYQKIIAEEAARTVDEPPAQPESAPPALASDAEVTP